MIKEHQVNVRFDTIELARVKALSSHLGIGLQETIRFLVKRESDALTVRER